MASGIAVRSCHRNPCPPAYRRSSLPSMRLAMASLFAGGASASNSPHITNVGHPMRRSRSHTSCPARASSCSSSPRRLLVALRLRPPGGCHVDQHAVERVLGEELGRVAGVGQMQAQPLLLVGGQRGDGVQRVAAAAVATGRRAAEHQPLHALGERDRELLRHHATEADAEHPRRRPADVVEQRRAVGGVVGHRRHVVRDRGAAQAPLVVHEHLEVLRPACR